MAHRYLYCGWWNCDSWIDQDEKTGFWYGNKKYCSLKCLGVIKRECADHKIRYCYNCPKTGSIDSGFIKYYRKYYFCSKKCKHDYHKKLVCIYCKKKIKLFAQYCVHYYHHTFTSDPTPMAPFYCNFEVCRTEHAKESEEEEKEESEIADEKQEY